MDYWLALGILLAGCGVGALLTAAVHLTQFRKIKTDLLKASRSGLLGKSPVSPDHPKASAPEERSL
jgi:hypothetical protein